MTHSMITVFGGTGFLGRVIVRRLMEADIGVRIAVRHPEVLDLPGAGRRIERHSADIRIEDSVAAAIQGATGVVNAVGLYVEKGKDMTFSVIHVEGAERVARRAREAGIRTLVHISGIGADPASSSKYVRARAHGEQRVRNAFPEAIILRPSVLFGPHDAFLGSLKALTRLPVIPLFGQGTTRLQPVYVEDVASAVLRALETPKTAGRIFELGGARIYSYREIVEQVLAHVGRRRLLLPVPFSAWKWLAGMTSFLPHPPLTPDQIILMETDNVVGSEVGTFADLGIEPHSLEQKLSPCLGTGP